MICGLKLIECLGDTLIVMPAMVTEVRKITVMAMAAERALGG
jgi:hypothetical protein